MKKEYVDPIMIVEDFSVSEMVAKNCALNIDRIHFVPEVNADHGVNVCENGNEEFLDAYKHPEANTIFTGLLVDLYHGDYEMNGEPGKDYVFTEAHYNKTKQNEICGFHDVDNMSFVDQITGQFNCKLGDDVTDVNMNS